MNSESVSDAPLRKVVEAANITPISLHSLRRTYENLLRRLTSEVEKWMTAQS